MTKNTLVRRAVQLALVNAAAASVALPALAASPDPQTTPAPATNSGSSAPAAMPALQEVVVTGTRINIPGLKSISPVTSLSAKDITQTGATTIEDVLNQLPQVTADQGAMSSNGATGTASLNLRDLGPQRTLVLVNGQRLMPGDAGTNVADINNIPTALVERVDVLTGGASSVYGADAVAGVVNFVMNDHFQGFEIDANASAYQHDQHSGFYGAFAPAKGYGSASSSVMDASEKDLTFLMGSDFGGGKGNATAYLTYRKSNPVLQSARDFSRCTLATNSHGKVACSGSSTSPTGGFFATNAPGQPGYDFSLYESTIDVATGQFVPFTQPFNYGTFNYYIRPDTRWNGGYFAHYNIDENHQVYSSLMMMQDHTLAQIAPSGAFLASGLGVNPSTGAGDGGWTVNCNNPLLSAGELSAICGASAGVAGDVASVAFGRRNVEGGNRYDDLTHTGFRMVIGSQGNLTDNLSYDAYAQEGLTLRQENYVNDVSKTKLTYALNDVVENGKVICAANANGANGAPGCVPYDMWGLGTPYAAANTNAAGGPTAASVAYIGAPGLSQSRTEERVYHADFTYDGTAAGIKLPSANEGLVTNFGVEYREDFTSFRPDEEFLTGDLAGQGGATLALSGADSVKEGFVEARLPLVQDKPFAKEISINPGYPLLEVRHRLPHQHLQDPGRLVAGFELPLPRRLQPRGARAEPRRAIHDEHGGVGRQHGSLCHRRLRDHCRLRHGRDEQFRAGGDPPGAVLGPRRHFGPVRCDGSARQPGRPVQRPHGRQPAPEAGDGGHVHLRCRIHADLPAQPERHARLLRHQDQGRHQHHWREPDRQPVRTQRHPLLLQPGASRRLGLHLAV